MLLTAFLAFCGACNTPPAVTITAPQTGGLFTATPVAVTGTIVDDKGVVSATLTNGSTTYPLTLGAGGEFTQAVDLSQDDNLIVVTGVDAEDASGTASLFIGYAGPVAIQITSPPDGATVNADKVTVSGTLSNPDTLVTVNGVRAVVGSGTFSAFGVPLIPGANPMTALAMHPRFRDVVGTASATVQTAHAREAVKLLATTLQGEPPLAVDFSLTVDTDNPIVNYKWDLDADGVWEIDSPSQNTASATFTQARVYNARVLLTDSQGTGLSDVVPIRVQGPAQQGGSFASGSPSDIVRRQDRTYLVLDSASCTVTGYDAEGLPTGFAFGSCGSGDGEFQGPMGLAVNPSTGAIYVADTGNHRVQKFDAQGNFIFAFSSWTCGSSTGPFNQPYGIAVDTGSQIYVIDRGNGRMMSFTNDFCDCSIGTGSGFFIDPRRVEVDGRGHIYIIGDGIYNQGGIGSVNVFTTAGQYLQTLNADTGWPLGSPQDLLAENGRLYIADSGAGKVLVLNDDLEDLKVEKEVTGVFSAPVALAVGARAAMDSFLAVDSAGEVIEAELPVDSPLPVWAAVKASLAAADFPGALEEVCEESRGRYRHTFTVLSDSIPAVAAAWGDLTPETSCGDMVAYSFTQEETWNGVSKTVGHTVTFTRDPNGRWCIMGF